MPQRRERTSGASPTCRSQPPCARALCALRLPPPFPLRPVRMPPAVRPKERSPHTPRLDQAAFSKTTRSLLFEAVAQCQLGLLGRQLFYLLRAFFPKSFVIGLLVQQYPHSEKVAEVRLKLSTIPMTITSTIIGASDWASARRLSGLAKSDNNMVNMFDRA